MSGHFVYEIDERKLRTKLKELVVEMKQDSWSNFESYYSTTLQPKRRSNLQNFNLPLSMNIILPVIFGGIIVLISLFLYKYVVIQNPSINNNQYQLDEITIKRKITDSIAQANKLLEIKMADSLKLANSIKTVSVSLEQKTDSVNNNKAASQVNTTPIASEVNTVKEKNRNDTLTKKNSSNAKDSINKTITKENTKTKRKRQKKITSEATEDKIPDEIPTSPDENEASLKPN